MTQEQLDTTPSVPTDSVSSDTELLDWMIKKSACVWHASNNEHCWVRYYDGELTVTTKNCFPDARAAIRAAIDGHVTSRY